MCQLDLFSIYSVNYNFQFPIMTTQQYNNEKPTFLFYNIYMDKRELIQRATETIYEKLIYTLEREEQKRESPEKGRFQLREKAHSGSDIFARSDSVTKGFSGSVASLAIAWLDGVEVKTFLWV